MSGISYSKQVGLIDAVAIFGDVIARNCVEVSYDPSSLDESGWWAVTQTFEGEFKAFKFESASRYEPTSMFDFQPVNRDAWKSSMSQDDYEAAVRTIRDDIARGWVYQANLCRVLTAELSQPIDGLAFWQALCQHNPAPHAGYLYVPEHEDEQRVEILCASPELFLSRNQSMVMSSPIKGTAVSREQLLDKDSSENIMIVDLVRNDLSHVAAPGSVSVKELLRLEEHPGLVHLVSDVVGELPSNVSWTQILAGLTPPGSVSGAPKSSALEVIQRLEPTERGIYCGVFGWVDADSQTASLAVGIRTFWQEVVNGQATLNFGTGAGITWGSDPRAEWLETELKANHLLNIAANSAK